MCVSVLLSVCIQEYEAELQTQKEIYEAKMEEYEALQLQKKVINHFMSSVILFTCLSSSLPLPLPPSPSLSLEL